MNIRRNNILKTCYLRSACREDADRKALKSLFEREWEVFVVKPDLVNGGFKGETVCCEEALPKPNRGRQRNASGV